MIYRQPVTGVLYRSNFESSFALARCRARIAQMPIRNNSILRLWNGLSAATLISECNLSSARHGVRERPGAPPVRLDGQEAFMREIFASPRKKRTEECNKRKRGKKKSRTVRDRRFIAARRGEKIATH